MTSPIIVALDFSDAPTAMRLASTLSPSLCQLKVGLELFTAMGPQVIPMLHKMGYKVFLDLKLHDIPNTVAAALRVIADMQIWMTTVHACGGREMLEAASTALADSDLALLAVTVLTSEKEADAALLQQRVQWAQSAKVPGLVSSANDLQSIKPLCHQQTIFVTPGIRPAGSASHDQKRIATPKEALAAGSNYLVIGRPIVQAANPAAALEQIYREVSSNG